MGWRILELVIGAIVSEFGAKVIENTLRVAGVIVLGILSSFGLNPDLDTSDPSTIRISNLVKLNGKLEARGAIYVDLGNRVVQNDAVSLEGWGERHDPGSTPDGPYGDNTAVPQPLGREATVRFHDLDRTLPYRLLFTVWIGYCDDSFLLYANNEDHHFVGIDGDAGDAVIGDTVAQIDKESVVHPFTVLLDREWTEGGELELTFKNIASDTCGNANIYHLALIPDVEAYAALGLEEDALELGGLNLDEYCKANNFEQAEHFPNQYSVDSYNQHSGPFWTCGHDFTTEGREGINMYEACDWAYGNSQKLVYAKSLNHDDKTSWKCYEIPFSSS